MKKIILLFGFLFLGFTLADVFPSFPMSIHGNIKIGNTDISAGNIKIYDDVDNELSNYTITKSGKYGAEIVTDTALVLNDFSGNIIIKVTYDGIIYTVTQDQLDDTNKGIGCPSKTGINFVSKNCRYDINLTQQSNPPVGGGGGGGGGGGVVAVVTGTIATGITIITGTSHVGNIVGSNYSTEFNNAYLYSYCIGITTMNTIQNANMEGSLIRSHMAKMMVNYAVKVMSGVIDTGRVCEFNDIGDESDEMKYYIKLSCQLGIMGVDIVKFNPNGLVTRAEFGTVLSRVLYGDIYNNGEPYYLNHLKILKEKGIIKNNDPSLKELRGYVMIMLMRAGE